MTNLDDKAIEMMQYDGLAAAEKITGASIHDERSPAVALGLLLMRSANQDKAHVLAELGDTHWGIGWGEFLEMIQNRGFQIIERRSFEYTSPNFVPEIVIAADPLRSFLLTATSYGEQPHINGGNLYGTLGWTGDLPNLSGLSMSHGGYGSDSPRKAVDFSMDVREGLFTRLAELERRGFQFVPWDDPRRYLWLLDYVEDKETPSPWRRKRDEFFERAPGWVRAFIGVSDVTP